MLQFYAIFAVNCKAEKKIKEREAERGRGESSGGDSSGSALMSQKRCQRSFRSSNRAKQHNSSHTDRDMQANYFTHTRTERAPNAHAYALPLTRTLLHSAVAQKPPPLKLCMLRRARALLFLRACVCMRVCVLLLPHLRLLHLLLLLLLLFVETLKNHAGVNPRNLNLNCICVRVCVCV